MTPTFFINDQRYQEPWDESTLVDAMLGSLGHRIQAAVLDFGRGGAVRGVAPPTHVGARGRARQLAIGPAFQSWWSTTFGLQWGGRAFALPLLDWVSHGLLSVFFLVVELEIKREFTGGHLATRRAAALPVIAALRRHHPAGAHLPPREPAQAGGNQR